MQKRRFNKKKILGVVKTYHAKKRQIERNITDSELVKVLERGELIERDGSDKLITYNGYHVYVSSDLNKIITVIAPDREPVSPKAISSLDATKIKELIVKKEEKSELSLDEMSFEDYMKNHFPNKIK